MKSLAYASTHIYNLMFYAFVRCVQWATGERENGMEINNMKLFCVLFGIETIFLLICKKYEKEEHFIKF